MTIESIQQEPLRIGPRRDLEITSRVEETQSQSFQSTLAEFIGEVNTMQRAAGESVNRLVSGEPAELHDVMIAVEKAGVSFELMLEIRNKMLEAYQEVMRTQI
jgi:flagellar hook-basal body complex protein FliE